MSSHETQTQNSSVDISDNTPIYDDLAKQYADGNLVESTTPRHSTDETNNPHAQSVAQISDRIQREEAMTKSYNDTLASFDETLGPRTYIPEDDTDDTDVIVNSARDEAERADVILHDTNITDNEREHKLKSLQNDRVESWRQGVLNKRSDGSISPEDIEAELQAGPPWLTQSGTYEKSPRNTFRTVLNQELARLVESGLLSQEQSDAKKQKADDIPENELTDGTAQKAIIFARKDTKWDRDRNTSDNVNRAIGDLEGAVNQSNEVDRSKEYVGQALDELEGAVDQYNELNKKEVSRTIDTLDSAVNQSSEVDRSKEYVGQALDELEGAVDQYNELNKKEVKKTVDRLDHAVKKQSKEKRKGLFAKLREKSRLAKERKSKRESEKQSLREKLSGNKDLDESDNSIPRPGRLSRALSEFVRKRKYVGRHRKLGKASKNAMEYIDATPHN